MRYFVERATRWQVQRYHLLIGNTVTRIQASRPDGIEVPRPWNVVYRITQPGAASTPRRKGIATYNRDFLHPTETRSCNRCGQIARKTRDIAHA